jgi:hypothetical protein
MFNIDSAVDQSISSWVAVWYLQQQAIIFLLWSSACHMPRYPHGSFENEVGIECLRAAAYYVGQHSASEAHGHCESLMERLLRR